MLSINEVIEKIKNFKLELPSEPVNLLNGLGRVIADDVKSREMMPPCDICQINGYAISVSDIVQTPTILTKVGSSKNKKLFKGKINPGEAVQVIAGVPVPEGADTVIPLNKVEKFSTNKLSVNDYFTSGENISTAGIDISEGDIIFSKGTILTSRHIALASILRVPWLPVLKSPRVGIIICTDDEIENYNDEKTSNKLYVSESIGISIAAFVNARGGIATNLGKSLDISAPAEQILSFKQELANALKSVDLLIVVGGINNLDNNLLFTSLVKQQAILEKYEVAIGNGENIILGNKGSIPIIGLPGHQVSSLICTALFLKPVLETMLSIENLGYKKNFATLSRDLDEFDLANDYLYAKLIKQDNGDLVVSPVSGQDSLMLSVITKTDCIIVLENKESLKAGSPVEIIMFGGSIMST
ncbi:MAG: molybdopterin molybdotransferase MoeA [Alphaproteobacteria bacterium]